ncbi:pentapeptide repeat-containing protein [Stieleria magnilauensis]|uniref:pentapeptide repeat-containing protein n=1 Tax=Stieleria magnilauensis TaxID=2527963 RepID=UPI003AF7C0C6
MPKRITIARRDKKIRREPASIKTAPEASQTARNPANNNPANSNPANSNPANNNPANSNLDNSNLDNSNLDNSNLDNSNLDNSNLDNSNLDNSNLDNSNLDNSNRLIPTLRNSHDQPNRPIVASNEVNRTGHKLHRRTTRRGAKTPSSLPTSQRPVSPHRSKKIGRKIHSPTGKRNPKNQNPRPSEEMRRRHPARRPAVRCRRCLMCCPPSAVCFDCC